MRDTTETRRVRRLRRPRTIPQVPSNRAQDPGSVFSSAAVRGRRKRRTLRVFGKATSFLNCQAKALFRWGLKPDANDPSKNGNVLGWLDPKRFRIAY
jgi:hypothetical protein